MSTVSTNAGHGLKAGDSISVMVTVRDKRWWRRLWYAITFKGIPYRMETRRCRISVATSCSFEMVDDQ